MEIKDQETACGVTSKRNLKKKLMALAPYILGLLIIAAFTLAFLIVWSLKL